MTEQTCTNCRFTLIKTGGSLSCQRFPSQVRVSKGHWCGEWRPDMNNETEKKDEAGKKSPRK